jgi:lipoprotein-releasing system permease protein
VADLALIIASKREEIGMLGAMGVTPRELQRVFMVVGGVLAAAGTILGSTLGVVGARLLDRYRLLPVPGDVFFMDYVPFLVRPSDLVLVLVPTFGLSILASLYATQRAAALRPVEALRR